MSGLERRTPIQRGAPLKSVKPIERKPMKTRPVAVSWDEARDKVEEEGACRVCSTPDGALVDGRRVWLEAAHVVPKGRADEVLEGPRGGRIRRVPRDAVVPLCAPGRCHAQYDAHALDLLPFLFPPEEQFAVKVLGLAGAYKRTTGGRLD